MVALHYTIFPESYTPPVERYDNYYDYDEDDEYDMFYHYSDTHDLFFNKAKQLFIESMTHEQLKAFVYKTFDDDHHQHYLKKTYEQIYNNPLARYLKEKNIAFSHLGVNDYRKHYDFINDDDLEMIEKIYQDKEMHPLISAVFFNQALLRYPDFKKLVPLILKYEIPVRIDMLKKEIEEAIYNANRNLGIDTIHISHLLILRDELNHNTNIETLFAYPKAKEYYNYAIKHIQLDELVLYIHNHLYQYNYDCLITTLLRNCQFKYHIYKQLCIDGYLNSGNPSFLKQLQEKDIQIIEKKCQNKMYLAKLYLNTKQADKLYQLMSNHRILFHQQLHLYLPLLLPEYEKQMASWIQDVFYYILTKGKNIDVYQEAVQYLQYFNYFPNKNDYIRSILNDIDQSTYRKCSRLIAEIRKLLK